MFMVTNSVSLQILEAEMGSSWNLWVSKGLKYFFFSKKFLFEKVTNDLLWDYILEQFL